jgi:hypothetical protein
MQENQRRPFGKIAPDWVDFAEIPMWLATRFAIQPPTDWMHELFGLIRRNARHMHYRVGGVRRPDVDVISSRNGPVVRDPPGLAVSRYENGQITVRSWDDAGFDEATFTVSGLRQPDGTRARHPIEVRWTQVEERFERHQQQVGRETIAKSTNATAESASSKSQTIGTGRDGRPPKHAWDDFWIEVVIYAAANDLNERDRSELQKHMSKWTAENWVEPPDEATIRAKLAKLYKLARTRA